MTRLVRGLILCAATAAAAFGQFTTVNCAQITGTSGQSGSMPMYIYDGPALLATVTANPTFTLTTPGAIKDNQQHLLSLAMSSFGVVGYVGQPFALTCPVDAPGYAYNYSDPFSSLLTANWTVNGATPTTGATGLTNSSATATSLIYTNTVPGVANSYEVKPQSPSPVLAALTRLTSRPLLTRSKIPARGPILPSNCRTRASPTAPLAHVLLH